MRSSARTTFRLLVTSGLLVTLNPWTPLDLSLFGGGCRTVSADEVRVVMRDGRQYQETYRVVRQPVSSIQWQQQEVTRYVEQPTTEMREVQRTVYVPRVRYEHRPRVRNRWNPFVQPQVTYELVARTYWELRTEKVRQPVTRRELVPEKRLVDMPRRVLGFDERRELVSRVPLGSSQALVGGPSGVGATPVPVAPAPFTPAPSGAAPLYSPQQVARGVGGIQRYDGPYPARRPAAATQLR